MTERELRLAAVVEDAQWLADTGSPAVEWPDRLGMSAAALSRALYRAGRRDLGRRVSSIYLAQLRASCNEDMKP